MAMTGLRSFDQSLIKTKEWLKDLQRELNIQDEEGAYAAFRSVSHALRDRITIDEAADLASQLPMLLVGVFYEGWKPSGKPVRIRTKAEFLDMIGRELLGRYDAEYTARAVFKVFEKRINKGEIDNIKDELPGEIKNLWPEAVHMGKCP